MQHCQKLRSELYFKIQIQEIVSIDKSLTLFIHSSCPDED